MRPEEPRQPDVADVSGKLAAEVMQRADLLGSISEEPHRLTRKFATPAMLEVFALAAEWMREAGMEVRKDNVGNLIGRYAGSGEGSAFVLGSHVDTVRDAGKYDGPLGVLVAIACVQRLNAEGKRLPFPVEVVAFADEEGLRYHTAYLGSKAYAGTFDPHYLTLVDEDDIAMSDAIRASGGDPGALPKDARGPADVMGYCEVHIEQGPVLERGGLPVGVVSAIAGQTRIRVLITGEAGHAGTVPMEARKDALCAAAEFVLEVESATKGMQGVVATVGHIQVEPGASNVIPGRVVLSLDMRHPGDDERHEVAEEMRTRAEAICRRRGVALEWQVLQDNPAVRCATYLMERLGAAVESLGLPVKSLPSGAGHDAVSMSAITPVAMLFVRCKGGISHNPAESVDVQDVAVAVEVMSRFLDQLAVADSPSEALRDRQANDG
jgi:allantoate deiminase